MRAKLLSLATAVPEHELRTEEVMVEAAKIFGGRQEDFDRMMPVYANTGINMRYSACSYDWFRAEQGWAERSEAFVTGASHLFGVVSGRALELAGLEADQIDTIVMISSTGIATPTIEARVMSQLGFRDDVARVPVFGLGCAGGIAGLSLAARLAVAQPESNVLVVVIEFCSLTFRRDEMTKSNIIATALFGDGAAAAVLSTKGQEQPWRDRIHRRAYLARYHRCHGLAHGQCWLQRHLLAQHSGPGAARPAPGGGQVPARPQPELRPYRGLFLPSRRGQGHCGHRNSL